MSEKIKVKCKTCHGTGKIPADHGTCDVPWDVCPACHGAGTVEVEVKEQGHE